MLDDKGVLDAVQRHLGDRSGVAVDLPGAAEVTWHPLLDGRIERCIETRTEKKQSHNGPMDLSSRPVYDTLAGVRLDPPVPPFTPMTKKLVLRDSVVEKLCDCGNGQVTCPRCRGQGDLPCEPSVPCATCHAIDPCARCNGTGRRKAHTSTSATSPAGDGVDCRKCGAARAACPGCQGQGRVPCSVCKGRGKRVCPDCDSAGTVVHKQCGGTGGTVTWTEGVITRTPRQERLRLPGAGPSRLARVCAREGGNWSETVLSRHDSLPADLAGQFTELPPRLTEHADEINRRTTLRYLPMARVAVHQQPHRIYYVFPGHDALKVRTLPSPHRTWQVAGALLAVLALLIALRSLI